MKKIILLSIALLSGLNIAQDKDKPEGTLPVELVYFVGDVVNSTVELRWGTATEVNNYGYDILRSDSSFNWQTIDFVQGYGNSNSPKDYLFIDTLITANGIYYYRLKQIDTDGKYELTHDTVTVVIDYVTSINEENIFFSNVVIESFTLNQNYPNPFNPETIISFELLNKDYIKLELFSINGEFLENLVKREVSAGTHKIKFNANHLSSGTYIYKLTVGNKSFSKKMLLIK